MSLDLGELVGYLKLEDTDWDKTAEKLPSKFRKHGLLLAGAAAGVGLLAGKTLADALEGAADAQATNQKVAATLGLTAQESARVGTLAGKLYAQNYGESVEDVQNSIGLVVAGIKGMRTASDTEVSKMTANVLSFSSAFDIETSEAVTGVSNLLHNKLAKDGPEALDLLTRAMQKVPAALRGDMLDAINEYGPHLHGLGFDGQQAFQLLLNGAKGGAISLDKAGDSLKEFQIRSTDMSTTSGAAYKAIGLNQKEMTDQILKGGPSAQKATQEIVKALLHVKEPSKQSQAALALFGTPLEDMSVDKIPKFLKGISGVGKGMDDAKGAADGVNKTLSGGSKAAMEGFTRQWEMVTQGLVKDFLPVITKVFQFLQSNPAVLQALALALGVAAIAITGITIATWAMNTALLANPITWVVIGVLALIAGIVLLAMNWDKVTKWIGEVWGAFVSWLGGTLKGIGDWFVSLWTGLTDGAAKGWGAVVKWFQGIPGAIGGFFTGVGKWLLNTGSDLLGGLLDGAVKGLVAFGRWYIGIPIAVVGWLAGAGKWLVDTGRDILDGLIDGAKRGLIALGRWELGIIDSVVGWLAGAGKWLVDTGHDLLIGMRDGAVKGLIALGKWELSIIDKVVGWLAGAGKWLLDTGHDMISGLLNGGKTAAVAVWKFLSGIPGRVISTIGNLGASLYGAGKDLIQGLLNGAGSILPSIGQFFLNMLPGWIRDPFKKAMGIASPSKVFIELGKFIVQGLVKGLHGSADDVAKGMDDLISKVNDGYSKGREQVAAARKKLSDLRDKLDDADTAKQKAAIQKQINEQEAGIKALTKSDLSKSAQTKVVQLLKQDRAQLVAEAKIRDDLMDQLDKAQDALTDKLTEKANAGKSTADSAVSGGNAVTGYQKALDAQQAAIDKASDLGTKIAGVDDSLAGKAKDRKGLVDKLADAISARDSAAPEDAKDATAKVDDLTGQLTDLDGQVAEFLDQRKELMGGLADAQAAAARSPMDVLMETLRGQVSKTQEYDSLLARLKALGLDQTTYEQLVGAGVDQGFATAQALAAGGVQAVGMISGLQDQLGAAATSLGNHTSSVMYDAGIAIARGAVTALQDKLADSQAAMGLYEAQLATDAARIGVNTSALMRDAGKLIGGELAEGLKDKDSEVAKAATNLAKRVKVPNKGKAARKAGKNIGTGLAKGMEDKSETVKDVARSLGVDSVKELRKALGIKSPSTVARGIMQFFGDGMILGAKDRKNAVADSFQDLVTLPTMPQVPGYTGPQGIGPYNGAAGSPDRAGVEVNIYGDVGMQPEDVAKRIRDEQANALALSGAMDVVA